MGLFWHPSGMKSFLQLKFSSFQLLSLFVLSLLLAATLGCSMSSASAPRPNNGPPPPSGVVPVFSQVIVVMEENHSYSEVIGNSQMPYLNSLTTQYGLATQYYANTHPSIGNYFELTTGQLVSNNDSFGGTVSVDNIVRHLITAGKTWKSYAESIPHPGYTGGDSYPYVKHHNPFAYFTDVVNSSTEVNNLQSLTVFNQDEANGQLPNFSFLVPNSLDDGHDGTLQMADLWLQQNLANVISSPSFQQNGLLIILFDEADTNDSTNGGGHVAEVIISPKAKQDYKSTTQFQHQSTLRLILEGLGVPNVASYPASASTAPAMGEFF
jgi:acid phosphatase